MVLDTITQIPDNIDDLIKEFELTGLINNPRKLKEDKIKKQEEILLKSKEESQEMRKKEEILTEDISQQYQDIIDKAELEENHLNNEEEIKAFFELYKNNNSFSFSADCDTRLVSLVRSIGIDFMLEKGAIKQTKNGEEEMCLRRIIGEVIMDAVKHTPNKENSHFIVHVCFNPNNPRNFSFLVINPSNIMAEDFTRDLNDNETGTGFGSQIKFDSSNKLGGKNFYINIMKDGKKVYHGFEFVRI